MERNDFSRLVNLGEDSQLKTDLNKGVASLQSAPESWFRPHFCLNEKDGVAVIEHIAECPERADTQFSISDHPIVSSGDMWLNVSFVVYFEKMVQPTNLVILTPRQTAHIVKHLPSESRGIVLNKVKLWYREIFLKDMTKGLETITAQFEKDDLLLENARKNRIFDIHGDHGMDIPYTEWGIVGERLFCPVFFGTCFDPEGNGYERADRALAESDRERGRAVDALIGLARTFRK